MSSIYSWSTVAASNASSDSAIDWSEGMPPSAVNNSARQLEARVAELLGDIGGALTAGGTANALTVTANSAFTAYANGLVISLRIATDNSAAATLNVNGLGAKSIRKMLSTGESALTGAELQADGIYLLQYSAALNAAAGGWLLLNPTTMIASTTLAGIAELATDAEAIAKADTGRTITPSNLAALGASATFAGFVELATDAEAQTGTDTARAITPANLAAVTATSTRAGVVELATNAEAQTGTDTARAITPANLAAVTATETRAGVVELATTAEASTGTDTARAVTPAGLTAAIPVITAGLSLAAVGTYGFFRQSPGATRAAGYTTAAANLQYSDSAGGGGSAPAAGTWMLMGQITSSNEASLWLRIS